MEIKSTKEIGLKKINAVVYGVSGSGKTFAASTIPGKTLIIACDPGLLTLADYDIDCIQPKNYDDLLELTKMLCTEEFEKKYDTLFIDGITDINEFFKKWIVNVERPKVKGKDIGKIYDEALTQSDWGFLGIKLRRFIGVFINMPYNIIFTALEENRKNDKTGEVKTVPMLNGKLAEHLPGYFDFVLRIVLKDVDGKTERYFLTENTEDSIGKNRGNKLDRYEEPNFTKIINKIKGDKKNETK